MPHHVLRRRRLPILAVAVAGVALLGLAMSSAFGASPPYHTVFRMFANPSTLSCSANPNSDAAHQPTVLVQVRRGEENDTADLYLQNFRPHLAFDLFTIQNSNQLANGQPNRATANFGLAWYQSDIETNGTGRAHVAIKTILLDQIFGFDPAVGLGPTNTFHLGFWFNNPSDCGGTVTPFNGEHHAGPLAFITRPDAQTNLGPLCVNPNESTDPVTCNP
jgi:hypothetical protein